MLDFATSKPGVKGEALDPLLEMCSEVYVCSQGEQVYLQMGEGLSTKGGFAYRGGFGQTPPPGRPPTRKAGTTHPTGMLSCYWFP